MKALFYIAGGTLSLATLFLLGEIDPCIGLIGFCIMMAIVVYVGNLFQPKE